MASSSRDNNNSNNKKHGHHHHHPITFPTINEPIGGIDARIGRAQPSIMVRFVSSFVFSLFLFLAFWNNAIRTHTHC